MKLSCVWYVSGFREPWEADVINNLAEALADAGVPIQVYSKGGTANFRTEKIMSWDSLTFFERMKAVLFTGKLWHLWGDAPPWWGFVRLRARTVHTSLEEKPHWRGHPTRLFKEQAGDGENRIRPAFEFKATWADFSHSLPDDKRDEAELITDWNEDADTRNDITESWASLLAEAANERVKRCSVLVAGGAPSGALNAAFMTMRGVPVVAQDTPLIREILGPEGYVAAPPPDENKPKYRLAWKKALETAASDTGRSISATARRFLKENYGTAVAAESLKNLYESAGRGKV